MTSANTDIAVGILQAAIIAVPFWLTSTQYMLKQMYDDGDTHFRLTSIFFGSSAAIGLLSLLLAVRYSTDAVVSDVGGDVATAIRLVDLFTLIAFAMLVSVIADEMVEGSNPELTLKYSMTLTLVSGLSVMLFVFGLGIVVGVVAIVFLVTVAVYSLVLRPRIVALTRRESGGIYPDLLAATLGGWYRLFHRERLGPITPDIEDRYRSACEKMGLSEETINQTVEELKVRYGDK